MLKLHFEPRSHLSLTKSESVTKSEPCDSDCDRDVDEMTSPELMIGRSVPSASHSGGVA